MNVKVTIDANDFAACPKFFEKWEIEEVKKLDLGDFVINDIIFERKTLSDFQSSIFDGRITNQIIKASELKKNIFYVVYAKNWKDSNKFFSNHRATSDIIAHIQKSGHFFARLDNMHSAISYVECIAIGSGKNRSIKKVKGMSQAQIILKYVGNIRSINIEAAKAYSIYELCEMGTNDIQKKLGFPKKSKFPQKIYDFLRET